MNYARDRLDRHSRDRSGRCGLYHEFRHAARAGVATTSATRIVDATRASSTTATRSVTGETEAEGVVPSTTPVRVHRDDARMATCLRDVGATSHALYHAQQAWRHQTEVAQPSRAGDPSHSDSHRALAAGDFAQMAEFHGNHVWRGLVALFAYRLIPVSERASCDPTALRNTNDDGESRPTTATLSSSSSSTPVSGVINDQDDGPISNHQVAPEPLPMFPTMDEWWTWIQQQAPSNNDRVRTTTASTHCGCGDAPCGLPVQARADDPAWSATAVAIVLQTLDTWLRPQRSRPSRPESPTIPNANEMLRRMAWRDRSTHDRPNGRPNRDDEARGGRERNGATPARTVVADYFDLPPLFRIWPRSGSTTAATMPADAEETGPDPHDSDDDNGAPRYRRDRFQPLPPVLQLLALKLTYLVLPTLASAIAAQTPAWQPSAGRPDADDPADETYRELVTTYKSHHAYDVLIRAVLWGERRKEHRAMTIPSPFPGYPRHSPVWDRLLGRAESSSFKETGSDGQPILAEPDASWTGDIDELLSALRQQLIHDESSPNQTMTIPPLLYFLPSELSRLDPIFCLGDSHVLSLAWQKLRVPVCQPDLRMGRQCRLVVPVVVTGLKAWHLKPHTHFFTHRNWHDSWQRVEATLAHLWGVRGHCGATVLVSAGEIDCREGLGQEELEGYSTTYKCQRHVETTVTLFVQALYQMLHTSPTRGVASLGATQWIQQILVLPVPPHARQSKGRMAARSTRRETSRIWNDTLARVLASVSSVVDGSLPGTMGGVYFLDYTPSLQAPDEEEYVLHPALRADSTHMNSAFIPFLEKSIVDCGCDRRLL